MTQPEDIFHITRCLSTDDLYRYAAGTLDPQERLAAEKHMVDCSLCSACADDVRTLSRQDVDEVSRRISQSAAKRTGFGKDDAFSAAAARFIGGMAAVAALITAVVLLARYADTGAAEDTGDTVRPAQNPEELAVDGMMGPEPESVDEWELFSHNDTLSGMEAGTAGSPGTEPEAVTASVTSGKQEDRESEKESAAREDKKEPDGKEAASDTIEGKVLRAVVDIFRREIISGEKKGRKSGGADSAGGKAYSALFENEETYSEEGMPKFRGGDDSLKTYLGRHIRVTADEAGTAPDGSAIVSFVVNHRGSISEISLMKGLSEAVDREIVRSLRQMPSWESAEKKGREGSARYTLMVRVYPE